MFQEKIAVLGAGSWATALAVHLARQGFRINMWARREKLARQINESGENMRYLPGVAIPQGVYATSHVPEACKGCSIFFSVVPSHAFRETIKAFMPYLETKSIVVNCAKGIEIEGRKRLSQVFEEEAGQGQLKYVVLSGPSHAEEVGRAMPTAIVAASKDNRSAQCIQDILLSKELRVYTNPDVIGVELGGALKNVIALGIGIIDGIGFGDNAKAALMTRGLAEITRLGIMMGANPSTFAGLAGLGDLIVTCTSVHSRNRRAGIEIGRGKTLEQALSSVDMVVEGVRATRVAKYLASELAVEMPITEQIYSVLFEGTALKEAVMNLMGRGGRHEIEEVAMYMK